MAKRFCSFGSGFTDGPRAIAFSSDSKAIALGYEKRVDVWTGGRNPVKTLGEHGLVTSLAFAPDGKTLAAGIRLPILHGGDKPPRVIGHKTEVRLIDLATAKVVKVFDGSEGVSHMAETKLPVTALAFSPDGKKLIAGTGIPNFMEIPKDAPESGEVKVFDLTVPPEKPDGENKPGRFEGVVKEIDGKSILLEGGVRVLLNEKTEYLRETGFDAAPAKLSDITKGTFVNIGTRPDSRVAVVVVIGLIQPPRPM